MYIYLTCSGPALFSTSRLILTPNSQLALQGCNIRTHQIIVRLVFVTLVVQEQTLQQVAAFFSAGSFSWSLIIQRRQSSVALQHPVMNVLDGFEPGHLWVVNVMRLLIENGELIHLAD